MSHNFLYIDESGCLGFNTSGSSQYFVITLMKLDSRDIQKKVSNAVRRTLKNKFPNKRKDRDLELKGSKTTLSIKKYFLKQMPATGWQIYSVILNKNKVFKHLQTAEGKKRLYNYLAKFLLENVSFEEDIQNVDLYIDKCKNGKEIKECNTYLKAHLALPPSAVLNINHVTSHENPSIQAVDLFCWGIARKHHYEETEWYNEFSKNIIFEDIYLTEM